MAIAVNPAIVPDRNMSEEVLEQYSLKNRVDYASKLPCADAIIEEYLKWEKSKEGKEKEELYIYRRCGRLALTWGWYLEKLQEEKLKDIDWHVLRICSEKLKQFMEMHQDIYQKMLTTIVFFLFVFPYMKNGGELKEYQHRMLKRIHKLLPWIISDICEYPGIVIRMQFCKNIPINFGIHCLRKWKADGDKEKEVGEFIRQGKFMEEILSVKEDGHEHLRKMLEFMEEYTKESRVWQESYVVQLFCTMQRLHISYADSMHFLHKGIDEGMVQLPDKNENEHVKESVEEQFEKLSKKGINILETFFKYKNMEKSWGYHDIDNIKFFLAVQKEKQNSLSAEELDMFVKQYGRDVGDPLVMLLDCCRIKMADISKLYFFQTAICLYTSEEEMVRFYRKKLLPKEILYELIISLRKRNQTEKIPLLLQWMYEEE